MKRMLDQKLIDLVSQLSQEELSWLAQMKELISVDNTSITFNNEVVLDIAAITNNAREEEEPLFPLSDNAGKVLAVNQDEDGLVAVEKGTLLYKHELEIDGDDFTLVDNNSNNLPKTISGFVARYAEALSFRYNGSSDEFIISCIPTSTPEVVRICFAVYNSTSSKFELNSITCDLEIMSETVSPL